MLTELSLSEEPLVETNVWTLLGDNERFRRYEVERALKLRCAVLTSTPNWFPIASVSSSGCGKPISRPLTCLGDEVLIWLFDLEENVVRTACARERRPLKRGRGAGSAYMEKGRGITAGSPPPYMYDCYVYGLRRRVPYSY